LRWSQAFIPTLRDDPADAEAASHRLLVRGGFIRQLMAGVYSMLPLGFRVRAKVGAIIREEMDGIGAQEFLLPALHPAEIWRTTGRLDEIGDLIFRFRDRRSAEIVLGITHEEIFATLGRELASYRDLPQIWYQIQTKFRDEPRPKGGVLRTREFTMKDSYSFDIDEDGLDRSFRAHRAAYERIFLRLGIGAIAVEASSGSMGGSESVEFMVTSEAGEDLVVSCPSCGYAANVERATSRIPAVVDEPGLDEPEEFPTPNVRTIEDLVVFPGGAAADRQIKTLVYVIDEKMTLVLLRGDHPLNEQKLADAVGAIALRPAHQDEVKEALGAYPGSLGAVGITGLPVIGDLALQGRSNMTTGANRDDFHLRGVDIARDITVDEWHDLREVQAGESCPECGESLQTFKAIEVGHIFKLGRKYADALGATVLDENGETQTIIMGSYGIGLERNLAAVAEAHHDDKGIVWPVAVAPYEVVVTVVRVTDEESFRIAAGIYDELRVAGVDVILDDRDERPGVKFTDAELIGIPFRITVGPRGLADGEVEFVNRVDGSSVRIPVADAVGHAAAVVAAGRNPAAS
jgi:prolyl-tRNA synthetase